MAHGQQLGQGNCFWNSPDVPSSMTNSSHRGSNNNHSLLSNQFSNSIFNQLLQPSASQRVEAALQQGFLTLVPNHRSLAAAVQQQQLVAASLAAPNVHMLPNVQHLQRASQRLLAHDLAGQSALLSREEREAILQRFPSSSIGYLSSASQMPEENIRDQSMELDILAMNKAGGSKSGPGAASLPCQARGMPADHNSSTAYFDIPSYATHGQHLLCSYQTCRAAGVKFRYCLFCKKPVTKQNFRSRHLHPDLTNPDDASSEKIQTNSSTKKNRKSPASQDSNEDDGTEPKFQLPKICTEIGAPLDTKKVKTLEKTKEATEKEATKEKLGESPASSGRRLRWSTLLAERPSGFLKLNSWLAVALAVSDLASSWSATEAALSDGTMSARTSVTQQSQWLALLQERPRNNDAAARTAWIVKVLQISCPEKAREESEAASTLSTGSFPSVTSNPAAEDDSTKLLVDAAVPAEVAYSMIKEEGYDSGDVGDDDSKSNKRRKLGPAEETEA